MAQAQFLNNRLRARPLRQLGALLLLAWIAPGLHAASACYGSTARGRLEQGVQLPEAGSNFSSYSALGIRLGRTYVHDRVRDVVVAAYAALARLHPGKTFVYGETGKAEGGPFPPHRSHQNGLSVDFFVPVTDAAGQSVALPTPANEKFGYAIEFDADARYGDYRIDFEALGEHLYQLHLAARQAGIGIAQVILDPRYHTRLFATRHGDVLKREIPFMKRNAWVRHDEHYHVDFALPCRPLTRRSP